MILPDNKNNRSAYLDVFRAFGIILMIMGHVGFGAVFDKFIHGFHVPMFFFVSGMLYAGKYHNRVSSEHNDCKTFLKKKARTLLLPYLLFGLLYYSLWLFVNSKNHVPYFDNVSFLKHFFWNNNSGMQDAGAFWFLTALFIAEIVYHFIDSVFHGADCHGKLRFFICFIIGIFGNVTNRILPVTLPFSLSAALSGVALLALGEIYESYREQNAVLKKLSELSIPWTVLIGFAATVIIMLNNPVNMKDGTYGIIPLYYIGVILAILAGLNISRFVASCPFITKWLQSIGYNSIVFLCLNQTVIRAVKLFLPIKLPVLPVRIVTFFTTLVILFFVSLIVSNTGFVFLTGRNRARKKDRLFQSEFFCFIVYVLACVFMIGCFAFNQFKNRASIDSENSALVQSVQLPVFIPTDITELKLRDCIKANLDVQLSPDVLENTMRYSFSKDSKISHSPEPTLKQGVEIKRGVSSLVNYRDADSLYIPNIDSGYENAVRPWAHLCFSQATAVFYNLYDEVQFTESLISYLCAHHISNNGMGWGNSFQSALWAENIGFAGWLLWPELSFEVKAKIARMVVYEADRFTDYVVPYYMDKDGNVIYPGNTKGEENAWNSRILSLALCMFPEHSHAGLWEHKLKELLLSSAAAPADLTTRKWVDILNGFNINDDGTVVNHNSIHIDYSSCIMEGMIETFIIYSLAGKPVPEEAAHNLDKLYCALVNTDLGKYDGSKIGRHFYERSEIGIPAYTVNMPYSNDWGGNWYASYFLNDVIADVLQIDDNCPVGLKASDWSAVHLQRIEDMLSGSDGFHTAGLFFSQGENDFVSGEMYQTQNLMKALILYSFE